MQVLSQQYQYSISIPAGPKLVILLQKETHYWLAALYLSLQAHQHSYPQYERVKFRQIHILIIRISLTYYQEKVFQSRIIHLQKRRKDLSVAFSACVILFADLPRSVLLVYYLYNAI